MLTTTDMDYARDWAERATHNAHTEPYGFGYWARTNLIPTAVGTGTDEADARADLHALAYEHALGVLSRGDELPEPTRDTAIDTVDVFTGAELELPTP